MIKINRSAQTFFIWLYEVHLRSTDELIDTDNQPKAESHDHNKQL